MTRKDVTFASGGDECAAWLYLPETGAPHASVVMAHGFSGTRRDRLDAYAERFAADGLAVLLFDYRGFGDSGGEPRQVLDVGMQLDDYRAALRWARSHDELDPARVALWGTSFSGGHVITLAAEDPTVAAAVAQTPFTDGLVQLRRIAPATALRATVLGLRDEAGRLRGRAPVYLPAVGEPGEVAAMTSPESKPGFLSILGEESRWRDEVAARIMLHVGRYRPIASAPRVEVPLLVCVADRDDLTPPDPAVRVAERAPRGELRRYPLGHFSIYTGEGFERAAADQSRFLRRHLGLEDG